jgi:hypothetical protein
MTRSDSVSLAPAPRGSVRFVFQATGLSIVLAIVALFFAWRWGSADLVRGVGYGSLLSLFLITSGYAAIRWAFHRPAKTFYSVVLGGMLIRFLIIGICLVLVRMAENVHIYGFVGAVMASYVVLQVFEIRHIQTELRSRTPQKGKGSAV